MTYAATCRIMAYKTMAGMLMPALFRVVRCNSIRFISWSCWFFRTHLSLVQGGPSSHPKHILVMPIKTIMPAQLMCHN